MYGKLSTRDNTQHIEEEIKMVRIQLFTSKSGKALLELKETFYAWEKRNCVSPIPFTVRKEHVEYLGDDLIHIKDLSSVKFGGVE